MASSSLPPRAVLGAEALAALAVPARYAILDHLLAAGPRTATQCAAVVGQSASNCSWHLRALAKVGLVEAVEGHEDVRVKPWRATAPGFAVDTDGGPAADVAAKALESVSVQYADALFHRYLALRELLAAEWQAAGGDNSYSLQVTPAELRALVAAVDDLLRPYVRPIRSEAPPDSAVVEVNVRAFLNPDLVSERNDDESPGPPVPGPKEPDDPARS